MEETRNYPTNINEIEEYWEQLKNNIIKTANEVINTKVTKQTIEDDPRLIANIWKDYYHDILNGKEETHTNQTEDTLTEEEENEVKCPTETEVQEEIRSLRNNKAPEGLLP
ncbi:hypothetical protein QE152_g11075 [Popillia japonica]|uniref:Uncharacterized protein n=1 Tax=Popillia japonica TaxID=7064 RepID=A0AAW1LT72_POPJA